MEISTALASRKQRDTPMEIEIKRLSRDEADALASIAPGVFDDPIEWKRAREFLADPRHHLIVAMQDGSIVGFVSAVHYVHPDKSHPELWINEVGVADGYRGRGIGAAILREALDAGRQLGCEEAWVLTERSNEAAMRLYASNGGEAAPQDAVMFTFHLDAGGGKFARTQVDRVALVNRAVDNGRSVE
jgi:ribosomal protein S18 acetylase RimI-like enzyme